MLNHFYYYYYNNLLFSDFISYKSDFSFSTFFLYPFILSSSINISASYTVILFVPISLITSDDYL